MTRSGKAVSLLVQSDGLKKSVHSSMTCVDCHRGFSPGALPHAKVMKPVDCQACHPIAGFEKSIHGVVLNSCTPCHGSHEIRAAKNPKSGTSRANVAATCAACHEKEQQEYAHSAHARPSGAAAAASPSCVGCHGAHNIDLVQSAESNLSKKNQAKLCLKCHEKNPEIQRLVGYSAAFVNSYQASVHGKALASGNPNAPSCADCHGAHGADRASSPESQISRWKIAETCSKCHRDIGKAYAGSIHGKALKTGNVDVPTCTSCHGEHQILSKNDSRARIAAINVSGQVCAPCHESVALNRKYGLALGKVGSFSDSYHGLALKSGSAEVANCGSCHGVHNIRPSSDPASTVNAANLSMTCGRCHPGANKNFAKGSVHVVIDRASGGILYWIRNIYISLIIIIIGTMILHNLLDFSRRTSHHKAAHGRISQNGSTAQYVRMTLNERIQHAAMLSSFILLVVTGFMLKFPDSWWVAPIRRISEHFFQIRSVTHRVAGVVMVAVSIYHLFYMLLTRTGRRFGADMLPRWKDLGDIWTNLRYLFRISNRRPRFDRFGYAEKAEYWALVWGVIIMAATGFVMWFDNYFIGLFTKLGWDISRTIHYYEACLATLAILVWHFYYVIFNPDVYPMNTAWLTGKISENEMAEEHSLEFERITAAQTGARQDIPRDSHTPGLNPGQVLEPESSGSTDG